MAGVGRNLWLTAALLALFALAAVLLRSTLWLCGVAALLCLAGVVLFRGERWRNIALLLAALPVAAGILDVMAGWSAPPPHGADLVARIDPVVWVQPDPDVGYRPIPNIVVVATTTYGNQTIYRATYTIGPDGTRVSPPAPPGADLYLFMGDSFMFGQGLADDQNLSAQFARESDLKVRAVNFSAMGWAPNHLVRALEAGLLDRFKGDHVKAVVTWIIPDHMSRLTGDGEWLGSSPRYVLEDGKLEYTGSFTHHRWMNPLAGLRYQAGKIFSFVNAIGMRQRQVQQGELFDALMLRLRALVREKFNAPLIVLYSWPDEGFAASHPEGGEQLQLQVSVLARLRKQGFELLSVDGLTRNMDNSRVMIPYDGHPNAFANGLVASELKRRLRPAD